MPQDSIVMNYDHDNSDWYESEPPTMGTNYEVTASRSTFTEIMGTKTIQEVLDYYHKYRSHYEVSKIVALPTKYVLLN